MVTKIIMAISIIMVLLKCSENIHKAVQVTLT